MAEGDEKPKIDRIKQRSVSNAEFRQRTARLLHQWRQGKISPALCLQQIEQLQAQKNFKRR